MILPRRWLELVAEQMAFKFKKIESIDDYKDCDFYGEDATRICNNLGLLDKMLEEIYHLTSRLHPAIQKELGIEARQFSLARTKMFQIQYKLWKAVFHNEQRLAEEVALKQKKTLDKPE